MDKGQEITMKHETIDQTLKSLPAVVGTAYSALTLNELVMVLTALYIVMQMGFLAYKWYNEHQDRKRKKK
jgi:hypothetical protein